MTEEKKLIVLERTYDASIEDVWDMWTTKEGIESWWGPEGFRVEVIELDLRVGGTLYYAMIAEGAPQIEFMNKAGMPLTTKTRITYAEITKHKRIAYVNHVDFVKGGEPYDNPLSVEFSSAPNGVHLVLTLTPLHDAGWTHQMQAGWKEELGKLEKALQKKK